MEEFSGLGSKVYIGTKPIEGMPKMEDMIAVDVKPPRDADIESKEKDKGGWNQTFTMPFRRADVLSESDAAIIKGALRTISWYEERYKERYKGKARTKKRKWFIREAIRTNKANLEDIKKEIPCNPHVIMLEGILQDGIGWFMLELGKTVELNVYDTETFSFTKVLVQKKKGKLVPVKRN